MLLEDLIITDTSKENVFELQENYPCCSRDMVITAGNSRVVPWHWHEELEILYVREGEIDYWTQETASVSGNRMVFLLTQT